jgi:hypothetical protein
LNFARISYIRIIADTFILSIFFNTLNLNLKAMKRRLPLFQIAVAWMAIIFSSCQKDLDAVKQPDEVMGTPLPGQATYCRIESFWVKNGQFGQEFRIVGYNEYENPTFISVPMVTTGSPFRTFQYDSWHRLKGYREEYTAGGFFSWHKYYYDNKGRIGADSSYSMGASTGDVPVSYLSKALTTFEYDLQNRIVKAVTTVGPGTIFPGFPLPTTSTSEYTYDTAGNLVRPGVTYDNKINLYRTNDIWMFLARDYSVNNPFIAASYNSTGFPTSINTPGHMGSMGFLNSTDIFLNHSEIGYSCRPAYW